MSKMMISSTSRTTRICLFIVPTLVTVALVYTFVPLRYIIESPPPSLPPYAPAYAPLPPCEEKAGMDVCVAWRSYARKCSPIPWWGIICDMESDWSTTDFSCKDKRMMSNWPVCFDNNLVPSTGCIVYSFGIDYDFRFDDAMANVGCTVYSFDPSMMDTQDHKRGDRVFFKRIGISDKDDDHYMPHIDDYVRRRKAPNGWQMKRLQSILDQLGHKKEQLTVLKMDIEGYEWNVTQDLITSSILQSIPQLLIEWHIFEDFPTRQQVPAAADTYFGVKEIGFRMFATGGYVRTHSPVSALRTQAEVGYVNTKRK
ncbi:uncharacterized protein LOC112553314 isoform X1 [Pomacea canaliculata]|uniref:uncharacterized protein LOC112553314 isoform X1 n=1 Tax=Pomacea canaliculata TaxID=400727 RepID=UPI000D72BD9B|nr:uncharacterized protein LOC112553314 isoform X1 [Pomacea canaliculata]